MSSSQPSHPEAGLIVLDNEGSNLGSIATGRRRYPGRLTELAGYHQDKFNETGNLEDLEKAIDFLSRTIPLTPEEDPALPHRLGSLGGLLKSRFDRLNELTDLDRAIDLQSRAISLTPQGHIDMPARLHNLGSSFDSRFKQLGELNDLEKAIEYKNQAISLVPQDHSDIPPLLSSLGSSLDRRFERLGDISDLDKSIEYKNQAVLLTPHGHPDKTTMLNNLGSSFDSRFKSLGSLSDLEKAIEFISQAVSLTPHGHPDMPIRLGNLGSSYEKRFKRLGRLGDLDEAIQLNTQAASITPRGHPDMLFRLYNLGSSHNSRFKRLGELADLDSAIKFNSQAVTLTPQGHPLMPIQLSNLSYSLESRYTRLGELTDLEKAIEHGRRAISLTPHGHPIMPPLLGNLGSLLDYRFERRDELVDLDEAIDYKSQAILLTPPEDPRLSTRLNSLGCSFDSRFERLGDLADINKAIDYMNQAVSSTPQGDLQMPTWLTNLGSSYSKRFKRLGDIADHDKAIELRSEAVSLTPQGHPNMATQLNNLGASLESGFSRLGRLGDLDKAIELKNQAVFLTPQGHPDMPMRLNNLASSLYSRYQSLGKLIDLDEAISSMTKALALTPVGHPSAPSLLRHLGHFHSSRARSPDTNDSVSKSIKCFQEAAESVVGHPFERFQAGLQWARMCVEHRSGSSLKAYQQTLTLLPRLVWLGSAVDSRYRNIMNVGNVSAEAAAVAISMQDYRLALEWLEEGRSIVWKQILQLCTPVDKLIAAAPTLAAELKQVAHDLDYVGSHKSLEDITKPSAPSLEQTAQKHHRLAEKWERLVDDVRRLPGFEDFMKSRKASELIRSAHSGSVVMVNVHESRSDALIIQSGCVEISHVPLTFTYETAAKARVQLEHLVRSRNLTSRYFVKPIKKPEDTLGNTLATLWTGVVKPVLEALGYTKTIPTSDLPRITWCTTGPLSFLPLHAAGDYSSQSTVFRYVISSYTPTLGALLSPPPVPTAFSGILAVGQESTPGMRPLPGTVAELARIREKFYGLVISQLDKKNATPESVLAGMERYSWIHLACHAKQMPIDPTKSAFYLQDGTLDLAAITQKQLKHADLAFLSACETATGDESLSDEAVHLAAGMLMAGYRTVIATMWSIGDEDAPMIAEEVYGHVLEGGMPDSGRAAVAVHKATELLREKVGVKSFAKWVPYIHIGL